VLKEDYDTIKRSLTEIIDELKNFNSIVIRNVNYNIKYTLGGDLQWLAYVTGVNAANAIHPCIWCQWSKLEKKLR